MYLDGFWLIFRINILYFLFLSLLLSSSYLLITQDNLYPWETWANFWEGLNKIQLWGWENLKSKKWINDLEYFLTPAVCVFVCVFQK